jgi:hypothetical protein
LEPTGRLPQHFTVVLPELEGGVEALVSCDHRTIINPNHES